MHSVVSSMSQKTGARSDGEDRLEVGHVVERRRDDLVAGADPGGQEREVQRGVTGRYGGDVSVGCIDERLERLFELSDELAHTEPADFEGLDGGADLIRPDQRLEYRHELHRRVW